MGDETFFLSLGTFSGFRPRDFIDEDNTVIYNSERHGAQMLFDVARRKGSSGNITATWAVIVESKEPMPVIILPMFGQLDFVEGQWNSSIHLQIVSIPVIKEDIIILVKFLNVSGGAMFGNFSCLKVIFPGREINDDVTFPLNDHQSNESYVTLEIILPSVIGALLIIGIIIGGIVYIWKRRPR